MTVELDLSMKLVFLNEASRGEDRAPLVPTDAKRLTDLGVEVLVQAGLGAAAEHPDADYAAAGAVVVEDLDALYAQADGIFR